MKKSVAILVAFFLASCPVAGAVVAGENPTVLIGHGHFGQRHWFVAATQDRKGICFETGAYVRTPRNGVDGGGQCSAPAVKRGILDTLPVPGHRADTTAMTVVGGAFNMAVKSVEVTSFDGSTERLVPRRASGPRAAGSTVANFRPRTVVRRTAGDARLRRSTSLRNRLGIAGGLRRAPRSQVGLPGLPRAQFLNRPDTKAPLD